MKIDKTYKKTFEGRKEEIIQYWESISCYADIGFEPIFGYSLDNLEIGNRYYSVTEGHLIHRKSENTYIFMFKDLDAFYLENNITPSQKLKLRK